MSRFMQQKVVSPYPIPAAMSSNESYILLWTSLRETTTNWKSAVVGRIDIKLCNLSISEWTISILEAWWCWLDDTWDSRYDFISSILALKVATSSGRVEEGSTGVHLLGTDGSCEMDDILYAEFSSSSTRRMSDSAHTGTRSRRWWFDNFSSRSRIVIKCAVVSTLVIWSTRLHLNDWPIIAEKKLPRTIYRCCR